MSRNKEFTFQAPPRDNSYKAERERKELSNDRRISYLKRVSEIRKIHEIIGYRIKFPKSWSDIHYDLDDFCGHVCEIIPFCPCVSPEESIWIDELWYNSCDSVENLGEADKRKLFEISIKAWKCFDAKPVGTSRSSQ